MSKLIVLMSTAAMIFASSAAFAQEGPAKAYPLCSKTVQDECMNRSEARAGVRAHKVAYHRHHHHKAVRS